MSFYQDEEDRIKLEKEQDRVLNLRRYEDANHNNISTFLNSIISDKKLPISFRSGVQEGLDKELTP